MKRQPPAKIDIMIFGNQVYKAQAQFAIELKKALGNPDGRRAPVTFRLGFVGVELHTPQRSRRNVLFHTLAQPGQDVGTQHSWVSVEAQAHVPVGVSISYEEPAID